MIELPLDRINTLSPYEVSYAPNGDFVFATSLGIHYLISFESEEPVGGSAAIATMSCTANGRSVNGACDNLLRCC